MTDDPTFATGGVLPGWGLNNTWVTRGIMVNFQDSRPEFPTLKGQIERIVDLDEYVSRRILFTEEEWANSWELHAYPHQLPPKREDWKSWTIIGSRRTGKTTAGVKWVLDKLYNGTPDTRILALMGHNAEVSRVANLVMDDIYEQGWRDDYQIMQGDTQWKIESKNTGIRLTIKRGHVATGDGWRVATGDQYTDWIWADEIVDAKMLMQLFPLTKQFVFTQPTKLPDNTVVSRAGDPRAY